LAQRCAHLSGETWQRLTARSLATRVAHRPEAENRQGVPDWRQHLHGRVAWATQLNPQKAQRLKRLFDRIDWRQ